MDRREYAKTLLQFRGNDIGVLKYLGAKWIIVKVLLAVVGTAALFCPHVIVNSFGIFFCGYVLGGTLADIRRYFFARRRWNLQQELFDWAKIESLAKENDKETNT